MSRNPSPLRTGIRVSLGCKYTKQFTIEIFEHGQHPHHIEVCDHDRALTLVLGVICGHDPILAHADDLERVVNGMLNRMLHPSSEIRACEWNPPYAAKETHNGHTMS